MAIASIRRGDPDKAKDAADPRQPLALPGIFPEVADPTLEGLRKAGFKSKQ